MEDGAGWPSFKRYRLLAGRVRKGRARYRLCAAISALRRRVTDDEITAIASKLIVRGRRLTADIGVEITRITDEMPSVDDLARVQQRIAAIRRPDEASEHPTH